MIFYEKYMDISQEVLKGFKENKPVIGLDSTVLKNFPYPENLNKIYEMEEKIKGNDGVPAMMALLNGRLKIGVSKEELEILAKMGTLPIASKKDIPYLILKRESGVLSFDSTLVVGSLSGIKVFLTGYLICDRNPIEKEKYIYKDLAEYVRKNVTIISCGVRSQNEMKIIVKNLETYDVPIIGYQIDNIPIYGENGKAHVNYKIETPSEIISFLTIKWELGISGGVVIMNDDIHYRYSNEGNDDWEEINLSSLMNNIKLATSIGKEIYKIK